LSHCWGKEDSLLKLTTKTRARLLEGIEIRDLPKTFRETAEFCSRIGFTYVWIDVLCELS